MATVSRLRAKWTESSLLRSRLASIGHLLSGNIANALIMLAGIAIAARALGPAEFGAMALVLTFGRIFERLVRFESWQPLIRFAAQEEKEFDPDRMARLYLYGLLLDIGAAALAAFLSVALGYLLAPVIGLEPRHFPLMVIYAAAILLNIRGMPTAALRMNGAFRTIAYTQIVANSLRVVLAFLCLLMGWGSLAIVIVWTAAQIFDAMLFLFLGFRALRKNGVPNPLRASPRSLMRDFPGFLTFAWSTNLSSTLRTMTQEADTLLVGAFAGAPAAGIYHIAKRCAKVAQQVGALVQTVLYPDMARLWASGQIKRFRGITGQVQATLAMVALSLLLACWIFGDWAIRTVIGHDFAGAYPILLAQLVAVGLIMHAAPSRSALLAMDRPRYVLGVAFAATAVFFAVASATVPAYGALGASLAHIGFAGLTAIMLDIGWLKGSAAHPLISGSGTER